MMVLVGCEESGVVRDAFTARGHCAMSCDLEHMSRSLGGWHVQCDVRAVLRGGWDMGIFFTPCTYLANSSNKHLYEGMKANEARDNFNAERWEGLERDAELFNLCLNAPIPKKCSENPIQHKHARKLIRKYDQIVQPHWFGTPEQKATCLWLTNLPKLRRRTWIDPPYRQKVWRMGPSDTRQRDRSETNPGMAAAMAEDWG